LPLDCSTEEHVQFFEILALAKRPFRLPEVEVPVTREAQGALLLRGGHEGRASGRKHLYAPGQGLAREEVLEGEVFQQGLGVHGAPGLGVGQDRLLLGTKQEASAKEGVIQRLYAVAVPGQEQASPLLVPDGEGEHAV